MRITYTAPNRAHHYPYAEALHRSGNLHAFVSGFSRLSPRSPLPFIGSKLERVDFLQTLYVGSLMLNAPYSVTSKLDRLSAGRLDQASYRFACESDAFIYYRTAGFKTASRLHKERRRTVCVMEEVNSHVKFMDALLRSEYEKLGLGTYRTRIPDYALRLKTYEESDCILCPSEFVRDSFVSMGFNPEKLLKVNFGFPPIESKSADGFARRKNGVFRMLYVGQLHYRKGLRYAIEAFRRLKHPAKEFILVGPRTPETGLERVRVPKGVEFLGTLKGAALRNQYERASVFVLPSLEEGLALVQGEALTFGLPLVITTHTGGADIIRNGREGFIVPPADVDQLTERLQQLADDSELREKMSCMAEETASSFGSWDRAAGELVSSLSFRTVGRN